MIDDRIKREIEFHDKRFEDDSLREGKVSRFYQTARKVEDRFWGMIEAFPAEGMKVLECGSGTNCWAFGLAERGFSVTAIDISQVAVDITQNIATNKNLIHNIDVRQMDVENLQFPDDSFDIVVGQSILHHLELDSSLAEISRVLKPSGKAIFKEPLGHNWLINYYRNRTPELRSDDEHPLLMHDIEDMKKYFGEIAIEYFGLTTIAAATLSGKLGFQSVLSVCEVLDKGLFKVPMLQRQAWMVLLELRKANQQNS